MDEHIILDHKDKVQIHISVPMSINDSFYRKTTDKIAGTLLGLVYPDHIEITNCYPIPLTVEETNDEYDSTIVVDKDHHQTMYRLNQQVFPKEIVVGFYCTNNSIDMDVAMLNKMYSDKENYFNPQGILQSPIFLTMDPSQKFNFRYQNETFGIKTYTNVQLCNIIRESFYIFQEIPFTISLLNFQQQEGKEIIQFCQFYKIKNLIT